MKKSLLTLMMGAAMLTASAATPPETLYVVGTMNDWTAPDMESGRAFQLTDPDGDMVYTGSLEIYQEGELYFKIFTAEEGWTNPDAYLGCEYTTIYLFNGTTDKITLGTWPEGFGSNIYIPNWRPGVLDLSLKLQEVDGKFTSGELSLSSKTQPDFPKLPDTIYVIGAFNDYKLPEGTNLNGAFPMAMPNGSEGWPVYKGTAEMPADKGEFVFYYNDPETEKAQYICWTGTPFSIVAQEEGAPGYNGMYPGIKDTFDKETDAFIIGNWTGGKLEFYYQYLPKFIEMQWDGAPLNDFPKQMNVVLVTPEGNKLYLSNLDGYCEIMERNKVSAIFFTPEEEANPAPENIWGVAEGTPALTDQAYENYALIKGGEPIKVEDSNMLSFFIAINRYSHTATVQKYAHPDYSDLTEIYMVGNMMGWVGPYSEALDILTPYILKAVGNGVYESNVMLPYEANNAPLFRFYSALTGWDGGDSLGAQVDDGTVTPILFDKDVNTCGSPIIIGGKGNWEIPLMEQDTYFTFRVDLNSQYLIITRQASGVNNVEAADGEAVYFNLQGVRVSNPANGIYLKVSAKGTEKVYIK